MDGKHFIFISGVHRSGTSLLHEILRAHPDVSGFQNTNSPQDEGQHLQTVYPPAMTFGGPGRFGFDPQAYMDEHHPLATEENAHKLYAQWSRYWNTKLDHLVEKSPPNVIRMRFLQRLFPNSSFVLILRHPVAVAYATKKWAPTLSLCSLIQHCLTCYERGVDDMQQLQNAQLVRFEDFVSAPQQHLDRLCERLSLPSIPLAHSVHQNTNDKYARRWQKDKRQLPKNVFLDASTLGQLFERRARRFGYSLQAISSLHALDDDDSPMKQV